MRKRLIPFEPYLVGDVGGLIDRISARAAPDFAVSIAHEEACDDDPDDCTEYDTADTRPNDYSDRDTGIPGGEKDQMLGRNGVRLTGLLLRRRGKTGIWPSSSTVDGSVSPGKIVGVGQTDKEWRCPREGNSPVDRVLVIRHDLVWRMERRGNEHGVRRPAIFWGQRDVRTLRWISVGEWGGSGSGYIT